MSFKRSPFSNSPFDAPSFSARSYLAGAATVVIVMAIGFGAGMQMTGFFDQPQEPNKLDRRIAEQADAQRAADDMKFATAPAETKAILPGTTTIAANAPSITAPEAPKPVVRSEPAMASAQRMKQTFAMQPRAAQPSAGFTQDKPAPEKAQVAAPQSSAPQPAPQAAPAPSPPPQIASESAAPSQPQAAVQPAAPDAAFARASDSDVEKARMAAIAEQKKAQQRKVAAAAERRRQREARLNAAADWVRGQPLDLGRAQRYVAGDYFGR